MRSFLHVGCGPEANDRVHPRFLDGSWREIRLDIDPAVGPDIIGTMCDLGGIADGSVEAVFSSHNLEHLDAHEVPVALAEFRRVLSPDGFLLVTLPDLAQIAAAICRSRPDEPLFQSGIGPITALDLLYGHRGQIAGGNPFMAHRTAFTAATLQEALEKAGFAEVMVRADRNYNLWAYAFMRPGSAVSRELRSLKPGG